MVEGREDGLVDLAGVVDRHHLLEQGQIAGRVQRLAAGQRLQVEAGDDLHAREQPAAEHRPRGHGPHGAVVGVHVRALDLAWRGPRRDAVAVRDQPVAAQENPQLHRLPAPPRVGVEVEVEAPGALLRIERARGRDVRGRLADIHGVGGGDGGPQASERGVARVAQRASPILVGGVGDQIAAARLLVVGAAPGELAQQGAARHVA
jgi:hypothetical protein